MTVRSALWLLCSMVAALAGCGDGSLGNGATPPVYQLTVEVIGPGLVEPAELALAANEQGSLTLQAEVGFEIGQLEGCAGSLQQTTFTTAPMTASCTLVVRFTPIPMALAEPIDATNTGTGPIIGSQPTLGSGSLTLAGITYFSANDGIHGRELWRTDGTPAGTRMVVDLHPGAGSSTPGTLLAYQGRVCFGANDGMHGPSLWCTDGTVEGTERLPIPGIGILTVAPTPVAVYQGILYFVARSGAHGRELWRTDGTELGTWLVRDIEPGSSGSNPSAFVVSEQGLLFFAEDSSHGRELWRSDGTAGGTVRLKDIATGPASGVASFELVEQDGWFYFAADDGIHGRELWRTKGTASGTELVANLRDDAGSNPTLLSSTHLGLMFVADAGTGDGAHLWRTNGVNGGAEPLGRTRPEASFDFAEIQGMHEGSLYFTANTEHHGNQLFRWSGTGDLERLTDFGQIGSLSLSGLVSLDSTMLFKARHPDSGEEAWRFTEGEFSLLANIAADNATTWPRPLASLAEQLIFSAYRSDTGRELWLISGSEAAPTLILDAEPGPESGVRQLDSLHHLPQILEGRLYYPGYLSTSGEELWRTDGTASGTEMVSDVCTQTAACGGMHNTARAGAIMSTPTDLYFFARSSTFGTPTLKRVAPIMAGSTGVTPELTTQTQFRYARPWASIGETLYLAAASFELTGHELWRVQPGGAASVVREINPGSHSYPDWLTRIGNLLYFTADDGTTGRELWRSDGTFAGTFQVADILSGGDSSNPYHLTEHQGVLYFSAYRADSGRELWQSDGTQGGTYVAADLYPGTDSSDPFGLTSTSLGLMFAARHPEQGVQVWLSDGTAVGTRLLAEAPQSLLVPNPIWIRPEREDQAGYYQMDAQNIPYAAEVASYSKPFEAVDLSDGRVVFRACTAEGHCKLWLTFGTAASTWVITGPGLGEHSDPGHLMVSGESLYFTATDVAGQRQLWRWRHQ